jgi:hypothetical protein
VELLDLFVADLFFGEGRLGRATAIADARPELADDHRRPNEICAGILAIAFTTLTVALGATDLGVKGLRCGGSGIVGPAVVTIVVIVTTTTTSGGEPPAEQYENDEQNPQTVPHEHAHLSPPDNPTAAHRRGAQSAP